MFTAALAFGAGVAVGHFVPNLYTAVAAWISAQLKVGGF